MRELILYSRPGCHLCEVMTDELLPLIRGRAVLVVRNIDLRPDWQSAFGTRIPVLVFDGREICEIRLDRDALESALAA